MSTVYMNKDEMQQALALALQENAYERLDQLAKQSVADFPEEAFGYAYLAEALLTEMPTAFPKVEVCLAKAAELAPDNPDYLARFAAIKALQGDEEAAQLMWGKVLSIDPDYAQALTAKGAHQLLQNEDYEEALLLLNRAIEQDAQLAMPLLYRAQVYNQTGRYAEALADIQQANTLQPKFDASVHLLTIDVYKNLQQFEQAASLYEELIAHDAEAPALHYQYAQLLMRLEKGAQALAQLQKASELSQQQDSSIEYALGEVALLERQYEQAASAFAQCLQLEPELNEAGFLLVDVLLLQKKYNEALENIQQLAQTLQEEPTLSDRATLLEAAARLGLQQIEEAEALLVPLAQKPGLYQADAYYQLGRLYHQQGDALKGFRFVKAAAAKNHSAAQQYLQTDLKEVVGQLRDKAMKANGAAFAANEQSAFLQRVAGKLWVFDNIKSERLGDFNAEQLNNIKQSLSSSSLLMAEKGILLLSENREQMATYKIQKETDKAALIKFLPLDGFAGFVAKLQLSSDGNTLVFSKEKGEALLYKAHAPNAVTPQVKAVYQENISLQDSAYLGDKATEVVRQLL